jgi:hypothetical protein
MSESIVVVMRMVGTDRDGRAPGMRPIFEAFAGVEPDRPDKIVILAEITGHADDDYRNLGQAVAASGVLELVTVGDRAHGPLQEGAGQESRLILTSGGQDAVTAYRLMLNRPLTARNVLLCRAGPRDLADRLVDKRPEERRQ